jgi:DNA-binding NtrC family response regulator
MTEHNIILYISDQASDSNSLLAALEETGCVVVRAESPAQAVAILYIMRTVAAVVLNGRVREQARFDVERSLRQIRPDVPVMQLCGDQVDSSLSIPNECVSIDELTFALQYLPVAEPVA